MGLGFAGVLSNDVTTRSSLGFSATQAIRRETLSNQSRNYFTSDRIPLPCLPCSHFGPFPNHPCARTCSMLIPSHGSFRSMLATRSTSRSATPFVMRPYFPAALTFYMFLLLYAAPSSSGGPWAFLFRPAPISPSPCSSDPSPLPFSSLPSFFLVLRRRRRGPRSSRCSSEGPNSVPTRHICPPLDPASQNMFSAAAWICTVIAVSVTSSCTAISPRLHRDSAFDRRRSARSGPVRRLGTPGVNRLPGGGMGSLPGCLAAWRVRYFPGVWWEEYIRRFCQVIASLEHGTSSIVLEVWKPRRFYFALGGIFIYGSMKIYQ